MKNLTRRAAIIGAILAGASVFAWWGSFVGAGVPKPERDPPSLREGSVRLAQTSGRTGTRYFIGGGIHGGK
ncbi:MAG: hypothetical protein KDB53_02350 [Planctomycetes bacterium]|nr:hypothetical protein [Planctomycetota bacterium]